jgi:hypothetical protein
MMQIAPQELDELRESVRRMDAGVRAILAKEKQAEEE